MSEERHCQTYDSAGRSTQGFRFSGFLAEMRLFSTPAESHPSNGLATCILRSFFFPHDLTGPDTMSQTENEYLRSLIRSFVGGSSARPTVRDCLDWEQFMHLVCHSPHVVPALGHLIFDKDMPDDIKIKLEHQRAESCEQSERLFSELLILYQALVAAGIAPIVLKGPVLALTVYPSPIYRFMFDLDFLVEPDKVLETCNILSDLGYGHHANKNRSIEFYERYQ